MAASRAGRSWRTSLAGAIAVHVALVTAAVLTTKIPSAPKEPPSFDIRLVQPWRPPAERGRQPPATRAAPSTPSAFARSPPAPAPSPVIAAQPAAATGPSPGDIAAVRNVLRGSLGCSNAKLYRLTAEEQARCARLLQARADPNQSSAVMIDPVKRTWFDASLRARKAGRYMPLGVPADYGIGWKVANVGGQKDNHSVKVGPLNVGLPPGAFNDDDAPPPDLPLGREDR